MSQPDYKAMRERVKEIDELLATGVSHVEDDQTITKWNHDTLRQERRRLEQQLPEKRKSRKSPIVRVRGLGQ